MTASVGLLSDDVERWWAEHRADLSDPETTGRVVGAARSAGLLDLPAPGSGHTAARWSVLAALAAADVTLAKLAEAHADAIAILEELSGPEPGTALWAVWAARTPTLHAVRDMAGRWRLDGTKPYASGYTCCARALVTAAAGDGERLFAIDPAGPGVVADESSWSALAMSGTRSLTLTLTDVPATPVGAAGDYTGRPGFWWGGAGIAACWFGGAVGVAQPLSDRVAGDSAAGRPDPHRAAHLGAVHAALAATAATLDAAAAAIDAGDAVGEPGVAAAMTVRAVAERAATEVLDRVGRALGPGPLVGDRAHARRVADLGLFLRQSHAEADLAELGRRVAAVPPRGLPSITT